MEAPKKGNAPGHGVLDGSEVLLGLAAQPDRLDLDLMALGGPPHNGEGRGARGHCQATKVCRGLKMTH